MLPIQWSREVSETRLSCSKWYLLGFPGGSDGKESACNAGDLGSIPGLWRSPGGGHGNPLQYSCLEKPHGQRSLVGYRPWGPKSRTQLSTEQTLSLTSSVLLAMPFHFPMPLVSQMLRLKPVGTLKNIWPVHCKTTQIMKNQKRLRNYHRPGETKETRWLNVKWCLRLD